MKKWPFLFLFIILSAQAQEDKKPYEFNRDDIFQYVKPLTPVNPEGYNRRNCVFANRLIRTMVNRFRALSFAMERRCRERSGTGRCEENVANMDNVVDKLNRQFVLVKAKCTPD